MLKNKRGITLIALVITIIILLILAGISIATLTGSGLFEKAKLAEQQSKEKQEEEEQTLKDYENKITSYLDSSRSGMSSLNMTSPKLLTNVSYGSGAAGRVAGTYIASSSLYTKNNTEKFNNYLSFEEDKGWTAKKSGFYNIVRIACGSYNTGATWGDIRLIINNTEMRQGNYTITSTNTTGNSEVNATIWLNEGDVIDFKNILTGESQIWISDYIEIYAMFE